MSDDIQKAPEITLLRSEMEAAAARVAERALNTTLDGVSGLMGDVFGGLIGDRVKQWRNRNLVTTLVKAKGHFDRLGIPIENAKALPMGQLYSIFDGMSQQDDPDLSEMWAALLANAMKPGSTMVIDPVIPKVLQQLSGVDAVILKFYADAAEMKRSLSAQNPEAGNTILGIEFPAYRLFLKNGGENIVSSFNKDVCSASIGNLLRTGLFYVETSFDGRVSLLSAEYFHNYGIKVDDAGLRDELANLYYQLGLASDNGDNHHIVQHTQYNDDATYFLPYDITRLGKRLLEACSPP